MHKLNKCDLPAYWMEQTSVLPYYHVTDEILYSIIWHNLSIFFSLLEVDKPIYFDILLMYAWLWLHTVDLMVA